MGKKGGGGRVDKEWGRLGQWGGDWEGAMERGRWRGGQLEGGGGEGGNGKGETGGGQRGGGEEGARGGGILQMDMI